jgi:hypothetical protein
VKARSWHGRVAAALACTLAVASCGAPPRARVAGADDWRGGPERVALAAAEIPDDPSWAAALPSLREVLVIAPSRHMSGSLRAEVLANDAAAPAYPPHPGGAAPAGAMLVEVLRRAPGEPVLAYLAMRKPAAGGSWEHAILSPDRRLVARASTALCARCHAEAPRDGVFGPPLR